MLIRLRKKIIFALRRLNFYRTRKRPCKGVQFFERVKIECPDLTIGEYSQIRCNVQFLGKGRIEIGSHTQIGDNSIIYSFQGGGVDIGDNVWVAPNCYIVDCDHCTKKDVLIRNQGAVVKPVIIGNDVWLGNGVTVLKGIHIHDGAVVGAGSVVTKDIPENAVSVGVPARVIKYRE